MNYIKNLLKGQKVEWKTLGEVCGIVTDFTAAGSFASNAENVKYIRKEDFAQLIRTTDLKANFKNKDSFIYVDEHAFKYLWRVCLDKESLILPNVGNCGEVYYVNPDNLPHKNNVLGPNALLLRSDIVLNKFLYHLFLGEYFQKELKKITSSTGQTKFNKTNLKSLQIPLPPLSVQQKIANILDTFTTLEAELEAELDCRKRQYHHYRDTLLTFGNEVEWKPLGKVCEFRNGFAFKSNKFKDEGEPILRIGNIQNQNIELNDLKYFDKSDYKENLTPFEIKKGDILIAMSGATTGKVGMLKTEGIFYLNQRVGKFEPIKEVLDNNYLYHYLLSQTNQLYILAGGGAQPNLSSTALMQKIKIPIPPIEEQKRIVNILDKFDTLTNSITEGLPKEIELRRKQYEYYREKLLMFND